MRALGLEDIKLWELLADIIHLATTPCVMQSRCAQKALEPGQIVVDRDRRKRDISNHARRPRRKLGYCEAGWHPVVAVAGVRCVPNLDVLARRVDILQLTLVPKE